MTATLDESTLKKARRMNALAAESDPSAAAPSTMLSFVSKSASSNAATTSGVTASTQRKVDLGRSLDSMLDGLGKKKVKKAAPAKLKKQGKKAKKSKARPTFEETMGGSMDIDKDAGDENLGGGEIHV